MIKKLFLFLIFTTILAPAFAQINEQYPDECYIEYLDEDLFANYLENNSFYNVTSFLIDDIVESNFTLDKTFIVTDTSENIDIEIIFSSTIQDSILFGKYNQRAGRDRIYIYVKTIKNYSDSFSESDSQFLTRVVNTFKHEISHYIDVTEIGLTEKESIFNIERQSSDPELLNNSQYFIDIYSDVNIVPEVKAVLKDSVNFTWIFDYYDEDKHIREVVARINAVCLFEVQNSVFTYNYAGQTTYCQNFNFIQEDADTFSSITKTIMEQYYFDEYPEDRLIARSLDNEDLCTSKNFFQSVFIFIDETLLNGLVNLFTENLFALGIIFILIGFFSGTIIILGAYIRKLLS